MRRWVIFFLLLLGSLYYYRFVYAKRGEDLPQIFSRFFKQREYEKAKSFLKQKWEKASPEKKEACEKLWKILQKVEKKASLALQGGKKTSYSYEQAKQWLFQNPKGEKAKEVALWLAEEAKRRKDKLVRWAALSVCYLYTKADPYQKKQWQKELDELSQELLLSPSFSSPLVKIHVVKKGEYLSRLARRYRCTWEFLMRINGMKKPYVWIGQKLKVIPGPFEILVRKREYRLYVLWRGFYVCQYPVGLGKDNGTPEGTFVIATKQKNPTWYWKGRKYPFGHPKNILGTRWLGFRNTEKYRGYGIHGTKFPQSIGKSESSGCIRMKNEDVEVLFDLIPRGTKVVIVP